MFPSYNGQYSMDTPFYQQLQLSPPSPKPDQPFYYPYGPCPSPPFAADEGFHLGAATAGMIDTLPTPRTEQTPSKAVGSERAGRKDRHSKICTAGGMRDRRMRLSLDVARRFFALQDTLGFDKASKTVHWLLEMSKVAIKELVSSSSECEDGSSLSDDKHKPAEAEKKPKARRATTQKTARKGVPHAATDKESRAKARERARERTREKHRLRWATLASSIAVEAPSSRDLHSSSSQNNEGWHDMAMAGEPIHGAIPALEYGSSSHQQQWELGGVVFNSHFY